MTGPSATPQIVSLADRLRRGADLHERDGDIGLPMLLRQAADAIEASPQPIETAPAGDGWILGMDPAIKSTDRAAAPWVIVTRCDRGWMDEEGHEVHPTQWASLPDPQPAPTGWRRAEGHIEITTGKCEPIGWQGWLVSVIKPDGSYDDQRDPDMCATAAEAMVAARKRSDILGLPIIGAPRATAGNDAGIDRGRP